MNHSVKEVADYVGSRVVGDASVEICGISSIPAAAPGDLVFVEGEKHMEAAIQSKASAIVAGEFAAAVSARKPLLISSQPRMAFARAVRLLRARPDRQPGIHSTAVVHPSATAGEGATIDALAVVDAGAKIGAETWIGTGVVVGAGVEIGSHVEIYPRVSIYPGVKIGNRVIIHSGAVLGSDGFGYVRDMATGHYEKFPQIGRLEIGDDVEIGANTTIDRGALDTTRIGRGAKIDNLVHIGHNCQIGENVVIAAQTGLSGSIVIERDVVLGGQVGIGEHARIEEGVMLGGQGGVLPHKVLRGKGIAFWGTPAKPVRSYLKELAALARLAGKR
jgi:UDP-3-O-[3-hydroxymyristoyl] glucosamine N-acyltransferase